MTAAATVITPLLHGSRAIQLANGLWRKRLLPVGDVRYGDRTLHFDRPYLATLLESWRQRVYDFCPIQIADASNKHTNSPEATRGKIVDMDLSDDGLWITAELGEDGERLLSQYPEMGISARITENFERGDGKFYDAAVQHALITLDPRVPGLGPWQPVEMSNGGGFLIDLSGSAWLGEPGPADDQLTPAEQAELEAVLAEVEAETAGAGLLAAMEEQGMYDEFDAAFTQSYAEQAALGQALQYAEIEDLTRPARSDEDKISRAISRISQGIYEPSPALAFANRPSDRAVELANERALVSARAACGEIDDFGRCTARYHDLSCDHSVSPDSSVELANAGVHGRALRNFMLANFSTGPARVWGDPEEDGGDPYATAIPARTIELAHRLAESWGLHGDTGSLSPAPGWDDLLGPSYGIRQDAYSALAAETGYPDLAGPQPQFRPYPDVSELARGLGLK